MEIKAVTAAVDTRFDADEAATAEQMLTELAGVIPDKQLVEETDLALAVHRRQQRF